MSRERNPRRAVLAELRQINGQLKWMTGVWDQRQTTYDAVRDESGRVVGTTHRKRSPDEQVENQAARWLELHEVMTRVSASAKDIADVAAKHVLKLSE